MKECISADGRLGVPYDQVRILHIVGDSKYGGGGVIIQRLSEMAIQQGWQVDVLTTDTTFKDVLKKTGIGVIDLDVIGRATRPLKDFFGLIHLYQFLKRSNYTIIHTHTSKAGLIGRLAGSLAKRKIIIHTVHGFAFHEKSTAYVVWLISIVERFAAYWCHKVVTVSNFHRDWALQLKIGNKLKVISIPNGIPDLIEVKTEQIEKLKKTLGLTSNQIVLLYYGRLAKQKGLEYLLKAVQGLVKNNYNIRLLLVGDGPLRGDIEKDVIRLKLENNVQILGFRSDINCFIASCDLIVLPTLREGLSISLLEAMAGGKPIITTKIGSNIEATRNGEAAVLVDTEDIDGLSKAIVSLSSDKYKSKKISLRARELFEENYTEQQMLFKYKKLYMEMIDLYCG